MVVVEEAWPLGSIATELTYMVQRNAFDYLDAPIQRVTSRDVPLPYANVFVQEYLPDVKRVMDAVKAVSYAK